MVASRGITVERLRNTVAVRRAGMDGFRFHDLRHTGNTLAAATGASTRELMARMGHSSPQAALRYQHATREREHAIADALSTLIEQRRELVSDHD